MVVDLRCAPWTLAEGVDPAGSAVRLDRLVLAEVPLPWPSDIADTEWLGLGAVPEGVRLQAIVPPISDGEASHPDGAVMVTRWQRVGARLEGTDWLVPPTDVHAAVVAVANGDDPSEAATAAPPEVLVCGHGSRDACCGGSGTRLAVEARAALPEVRVRRTSHLGGHRFAPTALCLPEGRAWAYLDADALTGVVRRTLDPTEARVRYRGHVALDPWAQVVEADRLLIEGWGAFDVDDLSAVVAPDGDDAADVELRWARAGESAATAARVRVRRRYPVLRCGLAPELAEKTASEYEVVVTGDDRGG